MDQKLKIVGTILDRYHLKLTIPKYILKKKLRFINYNTLKQIVHYLFILENIC